MFLYVGLDAVPQPIHLLAIAFHVIALQIYFFLGESDDFPVVDVFPRQLINPLYDTIVGLHTGGLLRSRRDATIPKETSGWAETITDKVS